MIDFTSIADRVYLARTSPLDLNIGLVIGTDAALLIDSMSTDAHAAELLAAVHAITALPLTVLNTHAHFDHCYGNAVVAAGGRPIWAHSNTIVALRDYGNTHQAETAAYYETIDPVFAAAVSQVKIQIPDHAVRTTERLDLGGRSVTISHHGHGHTDGDVVASVDDVGVIFAGDLVEEGAPPNFGTDSYPLNWPEAVAALLAAATDRTVIVPGHGAPVDAAFVHGQHAQLAAFAWQIRDGHAIGATIDEVATSAPWPSEACRDGVIRGYRLLDDPVDI